MVKRKKRGKLTPLSITYRSKRKKEQKATGSNHAARVWARRHVAGTRETK